MENQNSKHETLNPKQTQMFQIQNPKPSDNQYCFGFIVLGLAWQQAGICLEFRI